MLKVMTCRLNGGKGKGGRPYHSLPKSCSFLISVGKEHFNGKYLSSALTLINAEFGACTLIITGTLQRYNLATEKNISPEDVYPEAIERENDFIQQVRNLLVSLEKKCEFTFVQWDTYTKNSNFNGYLNQVDDLLRTDADFKSAMELTVNEFCEKHGKLLNDHPIDNIALFKENSQFFLREECAAMWMWRGMILYPSGASPVLKKMSDYINQALCLDKINEINWQALRFKETRIKHWSVINSEKCTDFLDTAILQKPQDPITQVSDLMHSFFNPKLKKEKSIENLRMEMAFYTQHIREILLLLEDNHCDPRILMDFLSDLILQIDAIKNEIFIHQIGLHTSEDHSVQVVFDNDIELLEQSSMMQEKAWSRL